MAATKLPTNYAQWWGSATNWNTNPGWKAAGAPNQFATKNALYDAANKTYQTYNNKDLSSTFDANTGSGASWMSNKNLSDLITSDGYGRYYDAKSKAWMRSSSNPDGTYKWTADDAFGQKLNDYLGSNALASSSNVYSVGADAGKNYYRLNNTDALGKKVSDTLSAAYGDKAKSVNLDSYLNKNYSQDDLAKMHAAGGIDKYLIGQYATSNNLGTPSNPSVLPGYTNTETTNTNALAQGLKTPGYGSALATASAAQLGSAPLIGTTQQIESSTGQIDPSNMAQWNAQGYTIDQNKDTVQGQLAGLLNSDNPILQRARTKALQGMNERGLLNSSMAQQSSDEAWYSAALPIAGEDAKAYLSNGQQNVQYQNQAGQFNADYANKAIFGNADSAIKVGSANMEARQKTDLANLDSRQKTALANLDAATKTGLANIESNYRQLMQANQSVGDYYKQAVKNIADIQSNPDLDDSWKLAAVRDQADQLRTYLAVTGSMTNLDLTKLLSFPGQEAATAATAATAASTTTTAAARMTAADFGIDQNNMNPLAPDEYATYKAGGGSLQPVDWYAAKYPQNNGLINSSGGN